MGKLWDIHYPSVKKMFRAGRPLKIWNWPIPFENTDVPFKVTDVGPLESQYATS